MSKLTDEQKSVKTALKLAETLATQTHYDLVELQMVAFSLLLLDKSEEDICAEITGAAEADRLSVEIRGGRKSQNTFLLSRPTIVRVKQMQVEREKAKDEYREYIKHLRQ